MDRIRYSGISPYACFGNNPISSSDPLGLAPTPWQRLKAAVGIGKLAGNRGAGNQYYVKRRKLNTDSQNTRSSSTPSEKKKNDNFQYTPPKIDEDENIPQVDYKITPPSLEELLGEEIKKEQEIKFDPLPKKVDTKPKIKKIDPVINEKPKPILVQPTVVTTTTPPPPILGPKPTSVPDDICWLCWKGVKPGDNDFLAHHENEEADILIKWLNDHPGYNIEIVADAGLDWDPNVTLGINDPLKWTQAGLYESALSKFNRFMNLVKKKGGDANRIRFRTGEVYDNKIKYKLR